MNTITLATPARAKQARVARDAVNAYGSPMGAPITNDHPDAAAAIERCKAYGKALQFTGYPQAVRLHVTPNGTAAWFWRYRFQGRVDGMTLGHAQGGKAPMSLGDALNEQKRLDDLRAKGIDPKHAPAKSYAITDLTVAGVAAHWQRDKLEDAEQPWGEGHAAQVERTFRRYILPRMGHMDIRAVDKFTVRQVINDITKEARAVGANARMFLGQMFFYAKEWLEVTDNNPVEAAARVKKLVSRRAFKSKELKQPAILDVVKLREILAAVEASDAAPMTKLAHRLIALTGLRKNEVQDAQWSELKGNVWTIPGNRMKEGELHTVVLSPQAQAVFAEVRELQAKLGVKAARFVFSHDGVKPIGRCTINELYERVLPNVGLPAQPHPHRPGRVIQQHSLHGWRAALRSTMNKAKGIDVEPLPMKDVTDMVLAHKVKSEVGAAYDRNDYLEQQGVVWAAWADILTATAGNVVPFKRAA